MQELEKNNNRTPSKIVYCYETKQEFIGLTKAARFCNLKDKKSISNVLDNPSKVAGGYHWCTSLDVFDGVELKYPTNHLPVKVYCYETKQEFNSLSEAAKFFNCSNPSKISEILNNPNRTASGYHFCTDLSIFDNTPLNKNNNKVIYCYETKQQFNSMKDTCSFFGVTQSFISQVIDTPNRSVLGYHLCTDLSVFDGLKLTIGNEDRCIEVYCYETKEKFNSLAEAAQKYDIFGGSDIKRVLNNPNRECNGYHFCTDLSIFDGIELTNNKSKIFCYETKEEFESIRSATRFVGLKSPSSIHEFIDNPHRTAAGKHFCTSLDVFDGVELLYPNSGTSSYEKELLDFLESLGTSNIITNTRKVISPLELDIYLPDYNLAIEFNGNYWHSEESGKGKLYHQEKTLKCLEKGIKLIQIFEHQWLEKKEIFKSVILNHLGTSNRIYARKCKIVEIDNVTDFLNYNHLQGSCSSAIKLGLFYNNELVSVMTFGKSRFNKNYDYELIRFCNKLNTTVIGGASKLLNYFKNKYSSSIISYANLQWSDGNLYDKLGFTRFDISSPNYWWIKKDIVLPRYKCQKHKLKKLMETLNLPYDKTGSELSIMKDAGFVKVYDCGNICFEYKEL